MTLLITFFVLAIGVSFACSLWESVLLSITPTLGHFAAPCPGLLAARLDVLLEALQISLHQRLSFTASGKVSYRLRPPTHTGQTQIVLDPIAFLRRLAMLVSPPRQNLIRFHGLLAPNARYRSALAAMAPSSKPRREKSPRRRSGTRVAVCSGRSDDPAQLIHASYPTVRFLALGAAGVVLFHAWLRLAIER